MTRAKRGGYNWRAELARAARETTKARRNIQRIVDERPGSTTTAMLLLKATLALGESAEALQKLKDIAE